VPVGNAGSSVVTPSVLPGGQPTIVQRAIISIRKLFFTAKDLADPERLYQVITQQQTAYTSALQALGSTPWAIGNLLEAQVFTTGQTRYIAHGLGKAWTGVICSKALGLPWLYVVAAYPPAVDATKVAPLTSTNAGVFDLIFF
jgi:hypothetical protein